MPAPQEKGVTVAEPAVRHRARALCQPAPGRDGAEGVWWGWGQGTAGAEPLGGWQGPGVSPCVRPCPCFPLLGMALTAAC